MKLVIHTQFCENYGAHDWDGKGLCPQYWKNKGGDTYVVECNLEQAQDAGFYAAVDRCIEHRSDYSEEYIIGESLVDDIDFNPDNVVAEWDTAIYAWYEDGVLACLKDQKSYDMTNRVIGFRTWLQDHDGLREVKFVEVEEAAA
jgi:hypothetical protein